MRYIFFGRYAAWSKSRNNENHQSVQTVIEMAVELQASYKNTTREFFALTGTWSDDASPYLFVSVIQSLRKNSSRFDVEYVTLLIVS